MSKIMQVLTQMGSDANLQDEEAIKHLLASTELNSEMTQAIVNKDITALGRQLDVCPDVVCFLVPAEDDEKEGESEQEDKDNIKSVVNL